VSENTQGSEDQGWPNWAKRARTYLLIATGLVLAVAGFLTAFGKAGDGFNAACSVLPFCKSAITPTPTPTPTPPPPKPTPPTIPDYSSGWVEGGHGFSTDTYCGPQKEAYEKKYPDFRIEMTRHPEGHRVVGTGPLGAFKHDEYNYSCSFAAVAK